MVATTASTKPRAARLLARAGFGVLGLLLVAALGFALRPALLRRWFVAAMTPAYRERGDTDVLAPRFAGADATHTQLAITLEKVAQGFEQPTDIQFPPGQNGRAVVLQKTGSGHWLDLANGEHGELLRVTVLTASEEGLLGLAFHPQFARNGRFFIDYVAERDGRDTTRIAEWTMAGGADVRHASAKPVRVLLEVEQPYPNHNAGQLAFGPDGMLYIGLGDGGLRDDPHGNGQDTRTLLGSMLRIDVDGGGDDAARADEPYRIPRDNPFVDNPGYLPEIWAYGLRNPWRYSFDAQGRLIVADVGQDAYEEIDIVQAGDNLGWNIKEGAACARKQTACRRQGLIDPVFVYGRDQGSSITGGFVYSGERITALRGLYVFADFVSGRLFAIALPRDRAQRVTQVVALGQWPILPSTFGRDEGGELYVASYTRGEIYRLAPAKPARTADSINARRP